MGAGPAGDQPSCQSDRGTPNPVRNQLPVVRTRSRHPCALIGCSRQPMVLTTGTRLHTFTWVTKPALHASCLKGGLTMYCPGGGSGLALFRTITRRERVTSAQGCFKRRQWSECGFAAGEEALMECRGACVLNRARLLPTRCTECERWLGTEPDRRQGRLPLSRLKPLLQVSGAGQRQPGIHHRIRIQGHTLDSLFHQPVREIGMV